MLNPALLLTQEYIFNVKRYTAFNHKTKGFNNSSGLSFSNNKLKKRQQKMFLNFSGFLKKVVSLLLRYFARLHGSRTNKVTETKPTPLPSLVIGQSTFTK